MATLSTPVGAPSLGNYIFSGLQTRNLAAVLVGCVAAAALALALDGLVRALEVGVRRAPARAASLAALGAAARRSTRRRGRPPARSARSAERGAPITIGAKTFTEQYILSEILARQARARRPALPTSDVRVARLDRRVRRAASPARSTSTSTTRGTLWATIMKRDATPPPRSREVLAEVEALPRRRARHHASSRALGFENAYALGDARRGRRAASASARSAISRRTRRARRSAATTSSSARAEWRAHSSAPTASRFREQRSMDPSLMYQARASGQVDVISAFSTDGRIAALGLVRARRRSRRDPALRRGAAGERAVSRASARRPSRRSAARRRDRRAAMRRMNAAVDAGGESPAAVARRFVAARAP